MVDQIREQRYRDERKGLRFDELHARTRARDPGLTQVLVRAASWPACKLIWRMRHEGREHVPASGPVIVAANHASFLDHFFLGHGISRPLNFIAKSQLFTPATQTALNLIGAFPIKRGELDGDAFTTAETVLARGGLVITYPQGGRSRDGELSGRVRSGVGRLALQTGAPIVPAAIIGSAHIREWRRGRFPRVTVRFGEPIPGRLEPDARRERHQQVANTVMERIRELYGGEQPPPGPRRDKAATDQIPRPAVHR